MSTEAPSTAVATQHPRVPVNARNGVILSNMDEMVRFSISLHKSGLAPKGFQNEQACFIAIQMGAELGLPPMASVQNIAVINGRPSLWGDAQLAVVRSTGELEEFDEWFEAGGKRLERTPSDLTDDVNAVCRVKRKGFGAQFGTFSVKEAKRADLWGKQGPWQQYPTRMLKFRARSFVLRDNFGDALRGLLTAEEVTDLPPMKMADVLSESATAPRALDFGTPKDGPKTSPAPAPAAPSAVVAPPAVSTPNQSEQEASAPPTEDLGNGVKSYVLTGIEHRSFTTGPNKGKPYQYLTLKKEDGSTFGAAWFATPVHPDLVGTTISALVDFDAAGKRNKVVSYEVKHGDGVPKSAEQTELI